MLRRRIVINAVIDFFITDHTVRIVSKTRELIGRLGKSVDDVQTDICPGQARQGLVISVMGRSVPTGRLVYRKVNKGRKSIWRYSFFQITVWLMHIENPRMSGRRQRIHRYTCPVLDILYVRHRRQSKFPIPSRVRVYVS